MSIKVVECPDCKEREYIIIFERKQNLGLSIEVHVQCVKCDKQYVFHKLPKEMEGRVW